MSAYRAVLLALFVVGGALVAAVPAGATTVHGDDGDAASAIGASPVPQVADGSVRVTEPAPMAVQNRTQNNSSLGADISSFMQSSAAEVGGAVETGMWTAAYNSTENQTVRVRLVERQTADLREELADIRERKAELVAERNATNVSDAAYKAKIGQLLGRIDALKAAINATTVRAKEVNANVTAVATLQTESQNLTGPEIAAVARNVTGVGTDVGVGNAERGPPSDLGNGTATNGENGGVAATENRTTNGVANSTTNQAANTSTNESQRGPPSRANAAVVGENPGNGMVKAPNAGTSATRSVAGDNAASTPAANNSTTTTAANNSTTTTAANNSTAASSNGNSTDDATLVLAPAVTATADLVYQVLDAVTVRADALTSALALA